MKQTSHPLNIVLAMLLGIAGTVALTSTPAVGYPASAVSTGFSPIVSAAGRHNDTQTTLLLEATEHDVVITDVVLSMSSDNNDYCMVSFAHKLQLSDGTIIGELAAGMHSPAANQPNVDPTVSMRLQSGLRVPAGDSLTMQTDRRYKNGCGDATVHYTVSGYLAQT